MDDLSRTLSTLSPSMICLKSLSALVSFPTPVARAGTKAQSSIGSAHNTSNFGRPRVMLAARWARNPDLLNAQLVRLVTTLLGRSARRRRRRRLLYLL